MPHVLLPDLNVFPASNDRWLLHLAAEARVQRNVAVALPGSALYLDLCSSCFASLTRQPPRLPSQGLANGNLCPPLPASLQIAEFDVC